MNLRELKLQAISASFLILCAACSSVDKDGVVSETPWLGPLHGFERVSGEEGFGLFLMSSSDAPVRFERCIVAAPEIIVSARSDLEAISPTIYRKIKALFAEVLQQELAKRLPTVNTSRVSNSVSHVIHAALTNVTITLKTPNSTAAQLSNLHFSFEESAIEVEIRLRQSNARQAVIVLPTKAEKTGWIPLRKQFRAFARQAAMKASKARSAINAKAD
mgnify:CR=1 FL=1